MRTKPDSTWGLCMNCQWWQIEPKAAIAEETVGVCIDENLQPHRLSITGSGGCNRFMKGTPTHGEGSSRQPPTSKPMR